MPDKKFVASLQQERSDLDDQIKALEARRRKVLDLLTDYGIERAAPDKSGMSNMEMVRQVLGNERKELSTAELRSGIRKKFNVDATKNLPQLLFKAASKRSSLYRNKAGKYGLLIWKKSGRKAAS